MTSLPTGEIPGPPKGLEERRRNHHLRNHVVAFLNEVKRVEGYVEHAEAAGLPRGKVEADLRSAEKRLMATAVDVVKVTGRARL